MDYQHIYDLSFVDPQDSKEINPHIVFSMDEQHLEVFQQKLDFIAERFKNIDEEYFGVPVEFTPLHKDIFGNYTFGYGRCGHVVFSEKEVHFHFELRDNVNTGYVSMTIWFLLRVLNGLSFIEDIKLSNRIQFIQTDTICQTGQHGHSMGGWISPDFGMWLKKQGEKVPDEGVFSNMYLSEVGEAMRQVWNKIGFYEIKENGHECRAVITPDGRFSLICPGDACDVSIYPEGSHGDLGERSVKFDCHNLDSASQQITFFVGLAKLGELARNDT